MKLRDATERHRLTLPGREVTRDITPYKIEEYLRATGWGVVVNPSHVPVYFYKGTGYAVMIVPSPRDLAYRLEVVVEVIASHERRSSGSTLLRIARRTRYY